MQFQSHNRSKNTWFATVTSREMIVSLALILVPVFYPKIVNAGLFSFFGGLSADKVSAKTNDIADVPNSQNMPLPKYAVNTDPNSNKSITTLPAVSGNALLAQIGPSGTASDIESQTNNTQISIYTVRSGDTLSEIAEMFQVSPNTIVWANDLNRNAALKEGQTLIILPISGIQHTVKKGDTIGSIVKKYGADLTEVLQFNDLSANATLSIGDTIIIPDAENSTVTASVKSFSSVQVASNTYYKRPIMGGVKTQGIHGHNGVDLAAPIGTPIYAAARGTVIASMDNGGYNGGYGNYVIISHSNGTQTLYAHNSKNVVKVGQTVEQGQMIAKMGNTGRSTGSHVHFEVRGARNPF